MCFPSKITWLKSIFRRLASCALAYEAWLPILREVREDAPGGSSMGKLKGIVHLWFITMLGHIYIYIQILYIYIYIIHELWFILLHVDRNVPVYDNTTVGSVGTENAWIDDTNVVCFLSKSGYWNGILLDTLKNVKHKLLLSTRPDIMWTFPPKGSPESKPGIPMRLQRGCERSCAADRPKTGRNHPRNIFKFLWIWRGAKKRRVCPERSTGILTPRNFECVHGQHGPKIPKASVWNSWLTRTARHRAP